MRRPEQSLQIAVVQFLAAAMPDGIVFAVPNAARRGPADAAMQKKAGLLAGIPDLCVIQSGRVAFVELKAGKGRVTDAQVEMMQRLGRNSIPVYVCRTLEDVERFLLLRGFRLRATSMPEPPPLPTTEEC